MKYINRKTKDGVRKTVATAVCNKLAQHIKQDFQVHDASNDYLVEEKEFTGLRSNN